MSGFGCCGSGGCGCGFSGRDAMMSPEDLLRKLSGVGFEEAEHEMCIGLLLNSRVSILCGDSVSRRSRSGINSAREHATVEKDASGNKLLLDIGLWLTQKMKVYRKKERLLRKPCPGAPQKQQEQEIPKLKSESMLNYKL
ncbi:hypothetical protein Tco_0509408 [Tanacetum coccineum]